MTATKKRKRKIPLMRRIMLNPRTQAFVAALLVAYYRFVVWTSRVSHTPADYTTSVGGLRPFVLALWHGECVLPPFVAPPAPPMKAMTSRSRDGGIVAHVLEAIGVGPIRASGGQEQSGRRVSMRGGVAGLIAARHALRDGAIVAMTADVIRGPGYVAGQGIIALARHSDCPIVPIAAAASHHIRLNRTWDRFVIALPFSRIAVVFGTPVRVPGDADDATVEAKRAELGAELDRIHSVAYGLVGRGNG